MILRQLEKRISSLNGASDWVELGRLIREAASEVAELSCEEPVPCRAVAPLPRVLRVAEERRAS